MCEYCTTETDRKELYIVDKNGSKVTMRLVENMLVTDTAVHTVGNSNVGVTAKARPFVKFCPMCGERVQGKFNIGDNVVVFNALSPKDTIKAPEMIHDFDGGNVVLSSGERVAPKLLIKV